MLTRDQQVLLKRAQREAGIIDADYRSILRELFGFNSSKDAGWTNRQFDTALSFFETIYWLKVDGGVLKPEKRSNRVFTNRGYWASKNTSARSSRDKFNHAELDREILDIEGRLAALGFGKAYLQAIQNRVGGERGRKYVAALERTLASKL